MNRKDFQQLAHKRVQESQALFDAKLYEGAYHLAGIAIECAIKACIAKQTCRFEFPDKKRANDSFDHDPTRLMRAAGLEIELQRACQDSAFNTNWGVVQNWKVDSRYTLKVGRTQAEQILNGITSPNQGVMAWLQLHW